MMETLLTLPIYLILLVGLFWLGEVCLIRLTVIEGENFTLWAKGNRHESDKVVGPYIWWFLDDDGPLEERMTTRAAGKESFRNPIFTANSWGEINSGNYTGIAQRVGWSLNVNEFVLRNLWGDVVDKPIDTSGEMEVSGSQSKNVAILTRGPEFSASGHDLTGRVGDSSYNNSTNWLGIAQSNWDNFIEPRIDTSGVKKISAHARLYERWSD